MRQNFEKATNDLVLSKNKTPTFFSCIKERWTVAIHYLAIIIFLFRVKTSATFILLKFAVYLALSD